VTETTTPTTTVEQTVRLAATPETVWSFWTDPARLSQWWGTATDVVVEPGGDYRIVMEPGRVMRGSFVELDPPHRLVFTFGWESNAPGDALAPGTTTVEVTLTPDGDGTELVLRHSDMPTTHAPDHAYGWQLFVGERLVAAAATR
jgi:uncharacterized protein YndB with AHSA1/START domain